MHSVEAQRKSHISQAHPYRRFPIEKLEAVAGACGFAVGGKRRAGWRKAESGVANACYWERRATWMWTCILTFPLDSSFTVHLHIFSANLIPPATVCADAVLSVGPINPVERFATVFGRWAGGRFRRANA